MARLMALLPLLLVAPAPPGGSAQHVRRLHGHIDMGSSDLGDLDSELGNGISSYPYFEFNVPRNVTTAVGQTAFLHCRVQQLGDKAMSSLAPRSLCPPVRVDRSVGPPSAPATPPPPPPTPSAPCCRICHAGVSRERLISPCHCKGSLAHVHRSCLEQWLNQAGRRDCELCLMQYEAVQTRRYSFCESFRVWLHHPRNRSHLQADFLICSLLTCVTVGLVVVCLLGMRYFILEGVKLGITHSWTRGAIAIFLTVIIVGYVITLYLLVRDQVGPWLRWWRTAVRVRLVGEEGPRSEETSV